VKSSVVILWWYICLFLSAVTAVYVKQCKVMFLGPRNTTLSQTATCGECCPWSLFHHLEMLFLFCCGIYQLVFMCFRFCCM